MSTCPFCELPAERIIRIREPCLAIFDLFPVTPGHALILPRRHVVSFSDLTEEEWRAVLALARDLKERIAREDSSVAGFNLGINDGAAAGQTVFHVHVHLIPRRAGDVPNPRGGVRGIMPGRADYPG